MKKDYSKCINCFYFPYCAQDDYSGFDSENPNCPNYEDAMKQLEALKED